MGSPRQRKRHHGRVALPSNQSEWSLAVLAWFSGVKVVPSEGYLHNVPIPGSIPEWHSAVLTRLGVVGIIPLE